ncbi:MAG: energy transducer TonB [Coraliomargaritaceae bacterium]
MSSVYKPPQGKGTLTAGTVCGIIISLLIFLAIPLTQIFTEYEKAPEEIDALEMAPPPPPPPPEDPPPPPEPEEEEPPPELDTPPPPLTLDMLDLALEPGTGNSLAGDFALPTFEVGQKDLGGLEIFDLGEVDSPPKARTQVEFKIPTKARRMGITGTVKIKYIVTAKGVAEKFLVTESPSTILTKAVIDTIKRTRFDPAIKSGQKVAVHMEAAIPF